MKKILLLLILLFLSIKVEALTIEEKWANTQEPTNPYNGKTGMLSYKRIFLTEENIIGIGDIQANNGITLSYFDKKGQLQKNIDIEYNYSYFSILNEKLVALKSISTSVENSSIVSFDKNDGLTTLGEGILSSTKKMIAINNEYYIYEFQINNSTISIQHIDENFKVLNTYNYTLKEDICMASGCKISKYIYDNAIYFIKSQDMSFSIVKFNTEKKEFEFEKQWKNTNYEIMDSMLNGNVFYVGTGNNWVYNTYDESALVNFDNNKYFEFREEFSLKDYFYDTEGYYISGLDTDGAVIYKLNNDFNKSWEYRVEDENSSFKKIIKIDNYIYAILQYNEDNGTDENGGHNQNKENSNQIIVLDDNGNYITEYSITNELLDNSEFHVIEESEHGFIIAGEKFVNQNYVYGVIAEYSIIHNIETKTDGNGIVEADHIEAENGTEVKFTVTPKEGYVLGEVKVTDKNGNVVIFTDYTFTMPNADVIIEATFVPIPKEDNPDTVDKISLLIITTFALGLVISHNNKKRISLN